MIAVATSIAGCSASDDEPSVSSQTQAVGLAPVNSLPTPQTVTEDSTLLFNLGNGNAISVSDGDNTILTVQISVTNGTFTLSGSAGLTVTGNGTLNMIATGPIESLNKALENSRYVPAANFSGSATLQINSSDSNGESDLDIMSITATPFNDPPVNVVPTTTQSATEDVPFGFTLSVTDPDIGDAAMQVSLTASNSTVITLPTVSGLIFTAGDGSGDAAMTFSGTLTSVNTAMNGLVVTPTLNFIGASTLTVTCNDQGASGGGDPGSDNDAVNLNWSAVNDPPTNTVPPTQLTSEETPVTFSAALGNALTVSDVDATSALVQVTLTAASGTATLGNAGLVSFAVGDGTADATMTFRGTLTSVNAALDGTVFTPTANSAGAASLTIVSNDLGNSGGGGAKEDSDPVGITVTAVNDAPVNAVPAAQTTNEDIARVFSTANGNAITVADSDASSLQVSLTGSNGTVTLGAITNLTFQAGDGTADATTTFTGTVAAVNLALNKTSFTPNANFFGAASLTVLTSDLGATGTGGTLTDQDVVAITVVTVNDAPNAANDQLAVSEDAAPTSLAVLANDTALPDTAESLTVTAVGTALHGLATFTSSTVSYQPAANYNGPDSFTYTVSDGNGGIDTATVAVSVSPINDPPTATNDSFTVNANSSGTLLAVLSNDSSAPDGGETLTISAAGTPAHGSAAIVSSSTKINYIPEPGYSGPDSFTYTIADGNGGSAAGTVTLDIVAINTNPVNALPGPQTTVEDAPLFFSSAASNAITVSDSNSGQLTVQLNVTNGIFTLGSTANLTQSGNGTVSVIATGSIAALNAGLNNARFTPTPNSNGPAALTINTSDSDGQSDLDTLTLSVTSFNDPPVNGIPPGTTAAVEDSPEVFNLSISDVDLDGGTLVVSLSANNGTRITLPTTNSLVFSLGDGTDDTAMTFLGTLAGVNTALNGLSVTALPSFIGASSLVVTSNDQGGTGAGSVGQDTDTININWAADNDPPVNVVPGAQAMDEDTTLTFSATTATALRTSDPDVAAGTLQVTLAATNGRLTLGDPGSVVFTVGDGLADTTMTFRGTAAVVNAALESSSLAPTANFTGTATVTMTTNDLGNSGGPAKTDVDTIAVTITAINDAPVIAMPLSTFTNEDTTRVFAVNQGNAVTVADVDAVALQVSLASAAGVLTLPTKTGLTFQAGDGTADASMTFTGTVAAITTAMNGMSFVTTPNFVGTGSITLLVSDLGATGAGGALSAEQTLAVTITAVNDAPTAVADIVTTFEDVGLLQIDVLSNDTTAPDQGETLTVSSVGAPAHGTTAIAGGRITYAPTGDYNGPDSFTYTIADGNGGGATTVVNLTVTPVNDPPNAVDDTFTVAGASTNNSLAVRTNDTALPDISETLTITAVSTPAHGTAVITGTGPNTALSYTPTTGYAGPDSFTYTLSDGNGASDGATVTITVTPFDSQPVAVADALTVPEDGSAIANVLANDTGIADAPLTVIITAAPVRGTAVVQADRTILYTPSADYNGADAFSYRVTDVDGDTASAQVTVNVTSVDDDPVAVPDLRAVAEDTSITIAVLANDTGLGDGSLTVTITTAATNGTATAVAGGAATYVPTADFVGTDTFGYTVRDVNNDVSTTTVTITVTPVNDAPVAVADLASTRIDRAVVIAVLANDTETDGDVLSVTSVTVPLHGTAEIQPDGAVRYVPATGYTGADRFDYTISDGQGDQSTAAVNVAVGLDSDGDGLLDLDEVEVHFTDPQLADTDGDVLSDGVEVVMSNTDPLDDDSDDDGLLDGSEDANGNGVVDVGDTAAVLADTDGDGLLDGTERGLAAPEGEDTAPLVFVPDANPATQTNPTIADTDGGSVADGVEDVNRNGRLDGGETDPNDATDDVPKEAEGGGGGCSASNGGPDQSTTVVWVLTGLCLTFGSTVRRRRHAANGSSTR